MGDGSKIEWTDATWNPIVGCSKVSPGCDHCYAVGVAHRGLAPQHRGLTVRTEGGTDWNGQINVAPDSVFYKPLHWTRPRRIFVNSLSDLFHPEVSVETIARVVAVMACAPQHTFQVLTKRPQRMHGLLTESADLFCSAVTYHALELGGSVPADWPLPNVWLGVSIESNRYAWRARYLRLTPAAVRWVSAEPLLGPLDQLDLTGIDWVVAGGESGPGSRPMHSDWVRDLRDRCTDDLDAAAPRPAFHFKQWGDWRSQVLIGEPTRHLRKVYVNVQDGSTSDDPPGAGRWVQTYRFGKRDAGRTLDCRTWDEYPAAAP